MIDTLTGKLLSTIQLRNETQLRGTAFGPDGRYIEVSGEASVDRHYLRLEDLIEQTCSLLFRNVPVKKWNIYAAGMSYRPTCPQLPSS
jgi:hypothetical protein